MIALFTKSINPSIINLEMKPEKYRFKSRGKWLHSVRTKENPKIF